ncbi:hypothetical protein WR25_27158 [Diploscapter pachys]|uniref:Uncharacterized protein n=1 Tax=Diploscapter pachys TaxID=2018661 RepID=A0A2A2LWC8_9BILA|nr:hypothetical protein WR25_27158 [Diploscapter pachys]
MNLSGEFVQPESFDKSYYEYLEMKGQSEREKDEDQLLLFIQIGNDAAHTILTVTIYIYLLTITWKSRKLTIFNRLIVLFCICNVFYRIFENTFFSQIIPLNNANNVAGPVIVALVSFYYLNKSLKNMGVSKFRRRSERWFSNMLILQATIDFAAYAICGCLFELVDDKNNKDEQSKIVNNILIAQIPSWVGVIDAIIMYFAVRSFFQKRRTSMFTITAF